MTERERLLEAVAEAAREWLRAVADLPYQNQDEHNTMDRCEKALLALDAHQPQPAAGETVTLAVWRVGDHYEWTVPGLLRGNHCTRLGTTTLRLDAEVRT